MEEDEKSVIDIHISCICIPKAGTQKLQSGGSSIYKRKCLLKIHVSYQQLYWLFIGLSESNQDAVSVEMTLSLANGFLLVHKCRVSVCFMMMLLFIFFWR